MTILSKTTVPFLLVLLVPGGAQSRAAPATRNVADAIHAATIGPRKGALDYIVRSRNSEDRRPALYGPEAEAPPLATFARCAQQDRHQFRAIVATQDACEYNDLRPFVRRLMSQVARDLRTPLDWVAADHYDTAHPHSHIVIRGVDAAGGDLIIAREYIEHGFEQRAAALVALDLGPDMSMEAAQHEKRLVQMTLEQPTAIDRDLLASRDGQGRVSIDDDDRWRQAERAGRLRTLQTMGLAHADGNGLWYLQPDLIERLGEIERRNRIERKPHSLGARIVPDEHDGFSGSEWRAENQPSTVRSGHHGLSYGMDPTDRHYFPFGIDFDSVLNRTATLRDQRAPTADDRGSMLDRTLSRQHGASEGPSKQMQPLPHRLEDLRRSLE